MDELTLLLVDWLKEQIEKCAHSEAEARDAHDPESQCIFESERYAYTQVLNKLKEDYSYLFEPMGVDINEHL